MLKRPLVAVTMLLALTGLGPTTTPCLFCFYGPDNMVWDSAGNMYLGDTDGKALSRLLKISKDRVIRAQWRIFSTKPGRTNGPEGIAMTPKGTILVADIGASKIRELSTLTGGVTTFAPSVRFQTLGHIAVDRSGDVYVSEGSSRTILKLSGDGTLRSKWVRPKGKGPDDWSYVEAIAAQPNGDLVFEDWANRRIEIMSPEGRTLKIFGTVGQRPGQFMNTAGVSVDSVGNIFVADIALHRIQEFDSRGNFIRVVGATAQGKLFGAGPSSLAVTKDGTIYAADGLSLVEISRRGDLIARWR